MPIKFLLLWGGGCLGFLGRGGWKCQLNFYGHGAKRSFSSSRFTLDKLGSHQPLWLKLLSLVQKGKLARA